MNILIDKWFRDVTPSESATDTAVRALKTRLGAVQYYLPLAAKKAEEDIEHVHQLRVWSRRAAAALDLYGELLPRRRLAWMTKQVRRLRRAANDARDCDVLAERLARKQTKSTDKRCLERVRAQRARAQRPIIARYRRLKRKDRFERQVAQLLRRARPRGTHQRLAEGCFGAWARFKLHQLVESFFKTAPVAGADLAALHRFRIRGKKLRYAMELIAGAFPPEFRERLYPMVETLQERLGEINDLATALDRLRRQLKDAEDETAADRLQQLLDDEEALLEQKRQEFLTCCTSQLLQELRSGFDAALAGPHEAFRTGHSPNGKGRVSGANRRSHHCAAPSGTE